MKKSILIVAGETSGDNLGAGIVSEWKKLSRNGFEFWGFGGEKMRAAGVEIVRGIEELSVIGWLEALVNYSRLNKYLHELVSEAQKRNISGVVLVDYPGFNLKLAAEIKSMNIPVFQVVSPQIWAWRYDRIYSIKKNISAVLCLFKFETDLYLDEKIPAHFIGHSVINKIERFKKQYAPEIDRKVSIAKSRKPESNKPLKSSKKIALLPGSRRGEVSRHLPFLLKIAALYRIQHPETFFEIPAASENIASMLESANLPEYIKIQTTHPYLTLATSDAAVVCSGTATLECALFNLPFLLIYKTSLVSYLIGKRLIQIPYIGLVNVIAGRFVTKEFIQFDMKQEAVLDELNRITDNEKYIRDMKTEFRIIRNSVYSPDPDKTAARILNEAFVKKTEAVSDAKLPDKHGKSRRSTDRKNNRPEKPVLLSGKRSK